MLVDTIMMFPDHPSSDVGLSEMLRRSPTRIELKIDDVNEWIAMRKEKEKKNSESSIAAVGAEQQTKLKKETIHERIGYDPTRASQVTNNQSN